ncbi:DUF4349 domain-containing protein [Mucilaginibacter sp. FT3.2]|uniref:DUF4349 domain-containing protein n=1 Tax=Mucilaginibacter sp. FT3.2 TaxID=2723090 RepID=UPI0016223289|nr:DUF4349 domain-containing protein [Mucilaginibacter sp. FT3.2]MBB6233124.1 hypothetical protein [Mucilaginibacter sp. FT3.2]
MKTYYLISFTLLLALSACGNKNRDQKMMMMDAMPTLVADKSKVGYEKAAVDAVLNKPQDKQKETASTGKKIIKEGEIRFQAENLKLARQQIGSKLQDLGGYVAEENETTNNDSHQKEYNLKIRVPSPNFDKFLESLSASADYIDTKNIRRRDVTTEFIDIETRLKNKQLLESRYLDLLKRSTKTSNLLQIEDKLTEIRTDIESTQGELNYLTSQVTYSSLDITFYHKLTAQAADEQFSYRLKTALAEGWNILQGLFFTIITIWPLVITGLATYWIFKKWMKKRGSKKVTA